MEQNISDFERLAQAFESTFFDNEEGVSTDVARLNAENARLFEQIKTAEIKVLAHSYASASIQKRKETNCFFKMILAAIEYYDISGS